MKNYYKRNKNPLRILIPILIISIIINVVLIVGVLLHHKNQNTTPVVNNKPLSEQSPLPTEVPTAVPVTATPAPTKEPVYTATIAFTGDLMVHSYQYEAAYDTKTGEYDFSNNFTKVRKYFSKADYVVGNLETTLGGKERGIQDYPRFNSPDSFASTLKDAGFDFLSTANNHCVDQGTTALCRTIDVLDELGFDHDGTYQSQKENKNIFITDINGISVAFLSCTYGTNGLPFENDYNVQLLDESFYKKSRKQENRRILSLPFPIMVRNTHKRQLRFTRINTEEC